MADIFVSYAREDRASAERIARALQAEGWSVWWDVAIPAGRTFDQIIQEAIDTARCVVVLWSATSVASEWVREEADEGKRRGILIPIQVEEGVQIPLGFRRIQTASFAHWTGAPSESCFRDLVRDISALLGSPFTTVVGERDREAVAESSTPESVESEPSVNDQTPNQSSGLSLEAQQRARVRLVAIVVGLLGVLGLIGGLIYLATRTSPTENTLATKETIRGGATSSVTVGTFWPHVLAVSGPIAALVVFISHRLQLRKHRLQLRTLRFELSKLQKDPSQPQWVRSATLEEIERYGLQRVRSTASVLKLCVVFVLVTPIAALLTQGYAVRSPEVTERPPGTGETSVTPPAMEGPSADDAARKAELERERIALVHQNAYDAIVRGSERAAAVCTQLQLRARKQTVGLAAAQKLQDTAVVETFRRQIEEHTTNISRGLKEYEAYLDQLTKIDPAIVTEEFDHYSKSLGTSNARQVQIARVMKRDYEARRRGAGPVDEKAMQSDCLGAVGGQGG